MIPTLSIRSILSQPALEALDVPLENMLAFIEILQNQPGFHPS